MFDKLTFCITPAFENGQKADRDHNRIKRVYFCINNEDFNIFLYLSIRYWKHVCSLKFILRNKFSRSTNNKSVGLKGQLTRDLSFNLGTCSTEVIGSARC